MTQETDREELVEQLRQLRTDVEAALYAAEVGNDDEAETHLAGAVRGLHRVSLDVDVSPSHIPTGEYRRVGPYPSVYGHGPVTLLGDGFCVCLDCGFTTPDKRNLALNECDRDQNPVSNTWRETEYVASGMFPEQRPRDEGWHHNDE